MPQLRKLILILALLPPTGFAQIPEAPPWTEVRAVLTSHCLACHGGESVRSGLSMANAASFARGGDRGPAVNARHPARSRLLTVVEYEDPDLAMPPTRRLDEATLATLRRWLLAGAPWPEGDEGELAAEIPDAEESRAGDETWWAYRPLEAPPVPEIGGFAHPVDAFLEHERRERGVGAAPRANATTLIRRAFHDLIGLPPTREERERWEAALAVDTGAAWPQLVEHLLASPHYGERQARHWLDVVRYAETNGYETDGDKPSAWRYRDWVIRAFNEDLPYDRFVVEQLAGDRLGEHAGDAILATGFLRVGTWDDGPADRAQARADEIADIVDTAAQAFLATTLGCARCHDHKADPITQRDYYAVTAHFNHIVGYGEKAMTRAVPEPPRADLLTPTEKEALVAKRDDELKTLARALAIEVVEPVGGAVLVGCARDEPSTWRYDPAPSGDEGWHAPGFDDSAWASGRGGFGNEGTPGSIVGTRWDSKTIRLRADFRLETIPEHVVLSFHHDEDIEVRINGVRVLERPGYRTDYLEMQLDAVQREALVIGRNVVTVECRQTVGGQYVDVGLRTGRTEADVNAWRVRLRDRARGEDDVAAEARVLFARRDRAASLPTTEPFTALVGAERGGAPPPQHIHGRGSVHAPGDVVAPGVPARFLGEAGYPSPDDDRRLALARWIVEDGSFLSARAAANRVWQHHFGRGLCRTSGDFGRFGVLPTHPELLDHLASELIARGWSIKALHRHVMSSEAYRMASVGATADREVDPRNDAFRRMDPRRMTAEEYRDSVLLVAGVLDRRLHGPSVAPPLPRAVLETASRPESIWRASAPEDALRRSIYVFSKRTLRLPLLEVLDQPDPDLPCTERFPTNVPTQTLLTLNGDFARRMAAQLASRLIAESDAVDERCRAGIEIALCRPCSDDEARRHGDFVRALVTDEGRDELGAMSAFCLALLNLNEFMWID